MRILLLFLPLHCFAQLSVLNREYELSRAPAADSIHTSLRPFFSGAEKDSIHAGSRFKRKVLHEHLFVVRDSAERFHFTIDPLFHFQFGKDLEDAQDRLLYQNSRGFVVRGRIGKDFSFETSFLESQARFSSYIDSFARFHGVIPGMGRWKNFDTTAFDFAFSSGHFTWKACRHFALTAGHGKHFIGEGYRSLLLSDNAFNYPYVRLTHFWKKWQYTNVYAMLMNLHDGGVPSPPNTERLFQKKPFAFHTLSWKPHRKFEIALFQGLIWNTSDSLNRLHMGTGYFLPLIFAAPVMYDMNNDKNVWMGMSFRIEAFKGFDLYSQFLLDETGSRPELDKSGFQIGFKYRNAFTVRNLVLQAEFNMVHAFAYAHVNVDQNISHYNQPLAHPLGAGFTEAVGLLDYSFKRFILHGELSIANHGQDVVNGNAGYFIWNSDSTANTSSFISAKNFSALGYVSYLINPAYSFSLSLGIRLRQRQGPVYAQNTFEPFLTLRTHLWNQYLDF